MNRKNQILIVVSICVPLSLLACGPSTLVTLVPTFTPTLTPTPIVEEPLVITVTPTPTPAPGGLSPSTLVPTDWSPRDGEIELHLKNFLDPASGEECVSLFPFTVVEGVEPATIEGEGRIDCHFQATYCGEACVTMHMIQEYDVTVEGEVVPGAGSGGAASLHVVLTLDGSVKEYFSDYPPEAIMVFTEDHPFVIEGKGPLPLDFDYVDGATAVITRESPVPEGGEAPSAPVEWIFILRLRG
jgi:hypothetical protein